MLKTRPPRTTWPLRAAICAVAVVVASQASAAPLVSDAPAQTSAAAADPVSRFLIERGLTTAGPALSSAGALVNQVRERAADMVMTAMNFVGVPYRRGGNTADRGFDCSGFTRQVFETSLGLILPRRADEQAQAPGLVAVERESLQPGDLVFFNTLRRTFSHVGIYIGEGKFIHAPRPGGEVRVEDMRFIYWAKRFTGARRAEPMLEAAPVDPQTAAPALTRSMPAALPATPSMR